MQQQRKRAQRKTSRAQQQRGGTFLGLVLGLIIGLAIAVVVALYITKAPTPFQRKAGPKPAEPGNVVGALPAPVQEPPSDPNKPLWSKTPPKPVGPQSQPTPTEDTPVAPHREEAARPAPRPADKAPGEKPANGTQAGTQAAKPAERAVADPIAEIAAADANKVGYLLQVGAFRSQDDANRQKANLAMQGFEAKVTDREVNGVKLYRVRLGPYNRIEDMNRARDRLQAAGFDASVIRFTKQ